MRLAEKNVLWWDSRQLEYFWTFLMLFDTVLIDYMHG